MSDERWIRPGCEGGACIEYQILGESVTIRDSATPEHPGLVFTVAEWDTFVGRLTAELRTELAITTDQLRDSRAMCYGHIDARDLDKLAVENARISQQRDKARALFEASGETVAGLERRLAESDEHLADAVARAENLDGQLTEALKERAEANKVAEQATRLASQRADHHALLAGAFDRLEEERDKMRIRLTAALNLRDAAIAEAAVLRHRDRRTGWLERAMDALGAAALHAAADAWDVWDVRGVADDFSAWLRDRATRTETP